MQVINVVIKPHNIIISGKNNTFINDTESVFMVNRIDIPHNINKLMIEDRNGLSLYNVEDIIEQLVDPETMLNIENINAKLIGFLNFNESNAEITDTIIIIDIPQIIPKIMDKGKICLLFLEFLKLFLAPFIKKTSLFKYF